MADYPNVMKMSQDAEALRKAWKTRITEEQAISIIYAYLDEDELPILDFTATTQRGRAWTHGKIRLPPNPSLGLTLHEIAHIIDYNDNKQWGHAKSFVRVLDGLVKSEILWEKEPYESLC